MVCIAAFIILAVIGVFVAILSIFKPKVWKSYTKALKKAWGCLWKKVRLQKCETGFKDDVKNTLLSRIMLKHPKWIKPLSILIEVLSVIIVLVAIWAVLTAVKSLLALWALGSCNVTKPSACTLGAEVCSIDESEPDDFFGGVGRWFTEWGEIFEAIPDKFHVYKAEDYNFNYVSVSTEESDDKTIAVDVFDPGCSVCRFSYINQKEAGFFDEYNVRLVPFAIQDSDNNYKFPNSETVVEYMFAAEQMRSGLSLNIIDNLFTKEDGNGISYQNRFNEDYSEEEVVHLIHTWLREAGLDSAAIKELDRIKDYPEISTKMSENRSIIENELRVKGIPTILVDGKKETGLWKVK